MTTQQWRGQRKYQSPENRGGEYLTFWYVGQIPPDAVSELSHPRAMREEPC